MRKIITILFFLFSLTIFSQQSNEMRKASKVKTTLYGEEKTNTSSVISNSVEGATLNGSIVADLSVSGTGGVNYTVPINVPPGLNGVQPDIALTFDSQSGNGLAGWGWNISGVSVITRIPTTQFHDNFIDPVDFDLNDRFALDGQRLIIKTGSYGSSGSVYQTEQYSNAKIVAYGTHPDPDVQGPRYFKVFYTDGSIAHYGYNNDSRSHTDYAISYWENPQGLRISYTYSKSDNTLYLSKIKYGSKGTAASVNEIELFYDDRKFIETSYIGGVKFVKNKILDKVFTRGSGSTTYRKYSLLYSESSLNYSRLESINESNGNVFELRKITFNYDNRTHSGLRENFGEATQLSISNIEKRNAKVVSLDFTGNGKMDFFVYPTFGADKNKKLWFFDNIQESINYSNSYNVDLFEDIFPVTWLNYENKMLPYQGLLMVQNATNNNVKFRVLGSGGAVSPVAFKYEKIWNTPTYKPQNFCGDSNVVEYRVPLKYISGDFNGDGLSDVIAFEKKYTSTSCIEFPSEYDSNCSNKVTRDGVEYCCVGCTTTTYNSNSSRAHFINLDRRITGDFVSSLGSISNNISASDEIYTADVNGDGKTDILYFKEGKVSVYSLNNNNNSIQLLWETSNSNIKKDFPKLLGDYNGDGKSDFLIPIENNSEDFVMFSSTGIDYDERDYKNQDFIYRKDDFNQGKLYGYSLIPIDINGDGKTDIVEYNTTTYDNTDNGIQDIRLHVNTANNFNNQPYPQFNSSGLIQTTGNLKHYPIPIFLSSNKENNNLEFATISNNWVRSYESLFDHRKDVTINKIFNNGVVTKIKYDQISPGYVDDNDPDYFPSYTAGYGQIYPFVNINVAPAFKVVRELEQSGAGLTRFQRYYYESAVSHANGLGFQGFEILKRSNWYGDNVPALWTISKHDPMLRGVLTEQITANSHNSNPSSYASKVNYFYDYTLIANPGSSSGPQYNSFYNRDKAIVGPQLDQAEQYINLLPGFYANGANGAYTGKIVPPEQQPGAPGYAGAVDIRLKRMENDNGLTGVLSSETYVYDQYNNQTTINTVFPGGSRVVNYTYSNNPTAIDNTYHIGKQEKMKETMIRDGNTFTTEEQYEYSNNLVVKIKRKGHGTDWITQDLQYDIYGNVTSKILKGNNVTDRIQQYEYGSQYNHRFLTKSIDIEGLETTFVYNKTNGNLTSSTDSYGLTTAFTHDKWNRIETETDYLNKVTHRSYTKLSNGALKYAVDYPDGAKAETFYNAFGLTTRTGALTLNNEWVYTDYEYYLSGKIKRESEPHNGSPNQWNTSVYDEYGRPISQQLYTGKNVTITYSGLSSTVNDGVKNVTTTTDALGSVVKSQDPGGTVDYTYFASGQLKTANYDGHIVTIGVDGWGRKTSLNDPSAGTYTYTYTDFGDLLEQTSPKGTTTYQYDDFGRITNKAVVGELTDLSLAYVYDNTTKQLTDINGVDNTNNSRAYTYEYEYDTYQRPKSIKENTGLANFEYRMTYDAYGRVDKETQISNLASGPSKTLTTRNVYDSSGILKEIWNDGTPDKLWQLNQINARNQALSITLGNGMVKNKDYDAYGYLTKIEDKETGTNATTALHTEYDFNQQQGTLNSRENFGFNWQESFGYDNQYRLTTISGSVVKTMGYDNRGRIDSNTDVGDYAYDTGNKYRLKEIDPNANGESYFQQHTTQQITYNAYKKPVDIHETGQGRVSFEYGPMMSRSTAYYGGEDEDRLSRRYRKHYSSIIPVEIVEDTQTGSTKIVNYIAGDGYTAPIAHIKQTGANAIDEYHYLHRDYLGSILAITDADGDVKEERQFGAWGTVDKFLDSNGSTSFGHASLLGRGYTGHEHFFEVSLIHMNGRMYDANLGRFLSPDNYIQDPFNTQNYNRYAYVLNNPLMYTDPSGEELITILAGILVAAIIGSAAVFGDWDSAIGGSGSSVQTGTPTPVNNQNNTQMASSMSRQSRGNSEFNDGGWIPLNIPAIEGPSGGSITTFDNMSFNTGGAFGISQTGSADPLQGIPIPDNFVPTDGLDDIQDQGFNITTEDIIDTALDFVPVVGGLKDIYKGIRDGNGWMVALGAGAIILDVVTLGGSSIVKGVVKTGIKAGARGLGKKVLTNKNLVQRAANLANKNIRNIRSTARFTGTAKHSHASELLQRYQRRYGDRGLEVNRYFNNGPGNRGFLDVLDTRNNTIYDFKFGKAGWGRGQFQKYQRNFDEMLLEIIRPQ